MASLSASAKRLIPSQTSLLYSRVAFSTFGILPTDISRQEKKNRPKQVRGVIKKKQLEREVKRQIKNPQPENYGHWELACGTILERYPTLMEDVPEWAEAYMDLVERRATRYARPYHADLPREDLDERMSQLEGAKSKQQMKKEKKRLEKLGAKKERVSVTDEDKEKLEALALLEEEAKHFQPASRITKADEEGDLKSINRDLTENLILLIKGPNFFPHLLPTLPVDPTNLPTEDIWQFPCLLHLEKDGSSRKTAERALSKICGREFSRSFVGNPPALVTEEKFPSGDVAGRRTFYHRAQFLGGPLGFRRSLVKDYAWVTKSQIPEYIRNEDLLRKLDDVLW